MPEHVIADETRKQMPLSRRLSASLAQEWKRSTPKRGRGAKAVTKKFALAAAHKLGLHHIVEPRFGGIGVIFTSHRIIRPDEVVLDPSQVMTTSFVSQCLEYARDNGYDIIGLDQVPERLAAPTSGRKFVCFTFDDGYRDNLTLGLPIFERYGAPLNVYVTTGFPDRRIFCWWRGLERIILQQDRIGLDTGSQLLRFKTRTTSEKRLAYLAAVSLVQSNQDVASALFSAHGVDPSSLSDGHTLSWAELDKLAHHPLVTIGAHSVTHPKLSGLDDATARGEMAQSKARLEEMLGMPVNHFAYPYGDRRSCSDREYAFAREIGFKTAVTTTICNIYPAHGDCIWSLPRISFDSTAERISNLEIHLSGLTAAVSNIRRRRSEPA
jgi:peptidoglycan/xylan/chitin deacetylase (PgdA/CDA1 family)